MRNASVLLVAALSACAGAPQINPAEVPDYAAFARADSDNSGKLSREEARALPMVAENFERFDADGDGEIAWSEIKELVGMMGDRQRRGAVRSR